MSEPIFEFHYSKLPISVMEKVLCALEKDHVFALRSKRNLVVFDPKGLRSGYVGREAAMLYNNRRAFELDVQMHLLTCREFVSMDALPDAVIKQIGR